MFRKAYQVQSQPQSASQAVRRLFGRRSGDL